MTHESPQQPQLIYIGVMSGTSLDGADAVALRIGRNAGGDNFSVMGMYSVGFDAALREACMRLQSSSADELHEAQLLSIRLAQVYAQAINGLLEQLNLSAEAVHAVGVHGQTIRHRPELGFSVQVNQPALIAELTGITVVSDFRSRDIAAGGQGAPLVPAFHDALWRVADKNRVVLNIGGFANISVLNQAQATFGFDTGPGNVLMDGWIARHQGMDYDAHGMWAASGEVNPALLNHLLSDPYFAQAYPKSTGRDHFNLAWLDARLAQFPELKAADVQASLLQLTAITATQAIAQASPDCDELIVAGGGAFNANLCIALREHSGALLPRCRMSSSNDYEIHPIAVEGAAFAWLAYRTLHGLSGNLPAATGAAGERILGNITPK